jgi:hypothetical protein
MISVILHPCRPREPGNFVITITWNGFPVRGSPFMVAIFDAWDELIQFEGMGEKVQCY